MLTQERSWYSAYEPGVSREVHSPFQNLYQIIERAAVAFPERPATWFFGAQLTFRQLKDHIERLATALAALGIKKGDRVAVMLPNCPQYVISYYAILRLGAVVVQTNPLYTERELEHQLKDAGAQTIIALKPLFPRIHNVKKLTPIVNTILTGIEDYLPFPKNCLYTIKARYEGSVVVKIPDIPGVYRFKRLIRSYLPLPPSVQVTSLDLAVLQYTGGTTGIAKGVMLSHHNCLINSFQLREWLSDLQEGQEPMLCVVPFFHVYGMTVGMNLGLLIQGTLLLIPRFDIEQMLEVIHKHRPTVFPGAPTLYIAVNNHPEAANYDLTSIRACISGSAPLPLEVQEKFEAITGGRLVEGYGLSEASPVTHSNPIRGQRKIGTIGVPIPSTDCRILDLETGETVPPGVVGEIAVSGPQVMQGYWNRPEETQQVLRNGWLLTGDIGVMDEDGFFRIIDRKKDVIIAGGYNIYPREVEEVLYEHPKIQEAVVVGVPDPYRGETVKAFIVTKAGETLDEKELDRYCRERLAVYKVPKYYEFRSELPKSAAGKILRRYLKEESTQEAPPRGA